MAFIPKLPKFQCHVRVWQYQPLTDDYEELVDDLVGQVYTQYRGQDDSTSGTLYFEYPVDYDLLRDVKDYNDVGKADVLIISFPTVAPRQVAYMVRDVQPRWLAFPNEHLIATLVRLSPAEFDILIPPPPPPPPPPPGAPPLMNLQYGTVTNDLCVTCNSFGNSRDLVLNEPSDPMSPNWELWEPHTCYPSEQVRFFLNYNRITGYLTAILFDDVGNVLVSWETNVVDWNYTDPTQLDQLVHTDVQCTWAFNVTVGL